MLAFQLLGDTYISMYLTSEKGVDESTFGIINAAWVVIELVVIIILNKFKIMHLFHKYIFANRKSNGPLVRTDIAFKCHMNVPLMRYFLLHKIAFKI